jgi:hypothetical protein
MFEEKSGMVMWREWRTTFSQRSPEIFVHRECAAEAGRRNGRKVSTQLPRPKFWKNRPAEKIKKKNKKIIYLDTKSSDTMFLSDYVF